MTDRELAKAECCEYWPTGCLRKENGYRLPLGACDPQAGPNGCEYFKRVVLPGVSRQQAAQGRKAKR